MMQRPNRVTMYRLGAIFVVTAVAAAGGSLLASSNHVATQPAAQSVPKVITAPAARSSLPTTEMVTEPDADSEPDPVAPGSSSASSPDVRNTSSASTTITVNGETIQVNGSNNSYQNSYTSDDGTTSVDISVQHSSSTTRERPMR